MAREKVTPLMQQYFDIKKQYPDTLLLFQVGDFYELFFDDAKVAASYLSIALTKRGKCNGEDVPLCGIPTHALKAYLAKLVRGGFRVAVCDQLTEPKPGTVVERGVTEVFSPGTLTDEHMLDAKKTSYLLSFYPLADSWGLLFGELLTAQVFATTLQGDAYRMLDAELARFFPDEVIIPKVFEKKYARYFRQRGYFVTTHDDTGEGDDAALEPTSRAWMHVVLSNNDYKRVVATPALEGSTRLFHDYLFRAQQQSLEHFTKIQLYEPQDYLYLDVATWKNLEIVRSSTGSRKNTLLAVVDRAHTAMGSRMISKWLSRPLREVSMIMQRQEAIALLKDSFSLLQHLAELLSGIGDLERIVGRVGLARATQRDYLLLRDILSMIPTIKEVLAAYSTTPIMSMLHARLGDFSALEEMLQKALCDELAEGEIIRLGFDEKLDRARTLASSAKDALLALQNKEIERSGITSLKIGYNRVSGYYIEVTKVHLERVPKAYRRTQTLANKERYVTDELIMLEREIAAANNTTDARERELFEQLKCDVFTCLSSLRNSAYALSYLDALCGFARLAYEHGYTCPTFNDTQEIIITKGRHPVVEYALQDAFTANDTSLHDEQSTWIVTGPNMGGKSTYLRQVALICILAQCGSFVPASAASLPLLDRVFTRIGAGDNVAEGKSTFLVEMEETATICNQATQRSLVILDEVGRGTSTFDGLSLAQAIVEHIHTTIRARCLFATHYHELTSLEKSMPGVASYHMRCERREGRVLFLHTIAPGAASGSFGLDVARLALMPRSVIQRAQQILESLIAEGGHKYSATPAIEEPSCDSSENQYAALEDTLRAIRDVDLDGLSPRQAFDLVWNIKQKI